MHVSSRSPCVLMHLLYNVDVLVTAHGFQSMLLLFLPLPSLLFEIFPYKYYKRDNAQLASEYGMCLAYLREYDFTYFLTL